MPLPSNFQQITLTGNYVDLEGTALNGTILFESTSSGKLRDLAAGTFIIPIAISATVSSGAFSVTIPTTNDPDIIPSFTYRVTETFPSLSLTRIYEIHIPYDIASPFSIADIAPVGENQAVNLVGIRSREIFGTATVVVTTAIINPVGIQSSAIFGATTGTIAVNLVGIQSSAGLGAVAVAAKVITPVGIPSSVRFGAPTFTTSSGSLVTATVGATV